MRTVLSEILNASCAEPTARALAVMRLSMLDWLACGIAGRDEPVSRIVREMVLAEGGAAQAALLGGGRAPARAAALVNGATSHALDYDDTHFAHIGHPSVAVLSAAMAAAQRGGADLDTTLRAALAGTEASVRIGLLLGRGHYQIGFHQTATAGAFGATLAASRVMRLTEDQTAQALGYVSTRASGLKSQFGTMGKPMNAGIAATNGIEAADLARLGLISNPDALDGPNGFLATHHADGSADQPTGFLMEAVSHKLHACCHGLHAMLEALATLPPSHTLPDRIEIRTHPRWMTVCNQPSPDTGLGAKFSYRTAAALAFAGHDTARLDTWSDRLATDPAITALRDRVTVIPDESLAETEARVTVDGADAHHDLADPVPLETRTARIEAKAAALLGEAGARTLRDAIETGDLRTVTAAF